MTAGMGAARLAAVRGAARQLLLVVLINVPTVSFGLALGWVSLASGESGEGAVVAAVTTFAASLLGVPLSAHALTYGSKFAVIATSATFVACWALKLSGGAWCVLAARVAAGLGAAATWGQAPLLAQEMCSARWRGAAAAALVPAHNLGVLLMYLAAQARLPHATVLWWCLALSVVHCFAFLLMPESPAFLAASGKLEAAERALRWLRGAPAAATLRDELATLPAPDAGGTSWYALAKDMMSDKCRRRAFLIGGFAVVGQEMCGVLALLQYAERVFLLVQDAGGDAGGDGTRAGSLAADNVTHAVVAERVLVSPAGHAVILGAVQLAASVAGLYLVERLGRRPMIVWSGVTTGLGLALGAALLPLRPLAVLGGVAPAGLALAVAVAADSAGLQPAPYALLADMFNYKYRGCAVLLVTAAGCVANALEAAAFPLAAALGGLRVALALAAALTLAYAGVAHCLVPETRRRTPREIYAALCPPSSDKRTHLRNLPRFNIFTLKDTFSSCRIEKGDGYVNGDIDSKGKKINKEHDANVKKVKEDTTTTGDGCEVAGRGAADCVVSVLGGSGDVDSTDLFRNLYLKPTFLQPRTLRLLDRRVAVVSSPRRLRASYAVQTRGSEPGRITLAHSLCAGEATAGVRRVVREARRCEAVRGGAGVCLTVKAQCCVGVA
ncbi:Sugar transporter ERD6-like 16 [Papilio machaon]|uniref:Sugar transporter ERD6-like 16 n=1 Tax=Papilio machaon TaxID=76193 RepID=A0A0N0PEN6_PAPMA|nr:Sugar transporter ERD6-like 16 [Papilio machaon]